MEQTEREIRKEIKEEKSRKQEEGKIVGSSTGRRRRIREQVERMKE